MADGSSYKILDAGSWEQPHGDHSHLYTTEPTLSSLEFAADHTGHVITHHQKTAMFADGTGTFEIYNPAELTGEYQRTAEQLKTSKVTLPPAPSRICDSSWSRPLLGSTGFGEKTHGCGSGRSTR